MKITISPKAEKQLKKISKVDQLIIAEKIRNLNKQTSLQALRGYKNIYRVRVGDYRIVYRRQKSEIYIILIGHRRDIYKMLTRLLG